MGLSALITASWLAAPAGAQAQSATASRAQVPAVQSGVTLGTKPALRKRPKRAAGPNADGALSTASSVCVDQGDPGCGGEPDGWTQHWVLNFRFATAPDEPVELEKFVGIGQLATCYIWLAGVNGDLQVVLPTCSLTDAMGLPEVASLSTAEFQALEAEVVRVAKLVQKCVKSKGTFAADSGRLWAGQAAAAQLVGLPVAIGDSVVVRYQDGGTFVFTYGGKSGGGLAHLDAGRPAGSAERSVCVTAG